MNDHDMEYLGNINTSPGPNAGRSIDPTKPGPDDGIKRDAGPCLVLFDRDTGGRIVREAWVRWARTQPNPKQSWLVPYNELDECDKEADRQIAEAVAAALAQSDAEPVAWEYKTAEGWQRISLENYKILKGSSFELRPVRSEK